MTTIISEILAKYAMQAIVAGVIALIAGGGFLGLKLHYVSVGDAQGYQRAINEIASNNKEAIDAADQARGRVRACINAGGVWDVTQQDGVCLGR